MRVLRVLTRPNLGGPMQQATALWHAHHDLGVRTVLAVGTCDASETAMDLPAQNLPVLGFEQALEAREAADGVVVCPFLRRRPRAMCDLLAARRLRALIRAFRPDVVHTHTTKAGLLGRRAARHERVAVVAHTFHGHVLRDYYPTLAAAWLQRMESRLARFTDLLIAVSPSCRGELVEMGIARAPRIHVVPPAVAVSVFQTTSRREARRFLGIADERLLLAFVGRLVPIKRPALFLDTLDLLPGAEGRLFGDGPLRAALQARCSRRVQLLGAVPDLHRYLAAFDALLLPSEREGAPLAAIEAFGAGVPVVGFDVPGMQDVLVEWGAGILVERQQGAAGLAHAVQHLVTDRALRNDVILQARAGLDRFQPRRVGEELLRLYEAARRARAAE